VKGVADRRKRKRTAAQLREEVLEGYRRLAFGSCNDALKLLFLEEPTAEQLARLDIFSVSDIKRPRGGGMEIKFFNRWEAMLRLETLSQMEQNEHSAAAFYNALLTGGRQEEAGNRGEG
jgi:hypothetical protein